MSARRHSQWITDWDFTHTLSTPLWYASTTHTDLLPSCTGWTFLSACINVGSPQLSDGLTDASWSVTFPVSSIYSPPAVTGCSYHVTGIRCLIMRPSLWLWLHGLAVIIRHSAWFDTAFAWQFLAWFENSSSMFTRWFIITGTRMKSGISLLLGHICG